MKLTSLLAFSALVTMPLAGNWNVKASEAKITFTIKGPFGTVNGSFSGLKAEILFKENDLKGSSVTASIDAKTVSTGIGLRNSDLRNKGIWLNTDKYPTISFRSKTIEKTASGFKALGDLTLKATTKPVELPFTFTSSGNTGLFKGQLHINREDYKLGNKGGSVGNPITISLVVPVVK